ncbi:unnamed protein product [Pleuronectes platessa]|uniref:Uncharacterized protein n=1 Tax=Pleuronectes platessa TaxID=8262 RepID=A0A9N7TUC1_PLEPL|nr:unnamed protein product [Pleuronectes platessa]
MRGVGNGGGEAETEHDKRDLTQFFARASSKKRVMSSSPEKRQCWADACWEMTGSSLSLTEAGENRQNNSPSNPLRRRRMISTFDVRSQRLEAVPTQQGVHGACGGIYPKERPKVFRGAREPITFM